MSDRRIFSEPDPSTQAGKPDPSSDLVAFDDCKAYPLPEQRVLLRNPRNGGQTSMPQPAFQLLTQCQAFRTVDQHVAEITGQHPGLRAQSGRLRAALESSLRDGLLVSARAVCADLAQPMPAAAPARATDTRPVAAIITWERPQALARLLDSMRRHFDPAAVEALLVIDDSRDAQNIQRNQALVAKYAGDTGAPARYLGQREQQAFLAQLIDRVPRHENAVRHLVDQARWRDDWTSGLARNWALLLAAGRRLVVFDDDTLCDVYVRREPAGGVAICNVPRDVRFFAGNSDWTGFMPAAQRDAVAAHLQCLGMNLSGALRAMTGGTPGQESLADADMGSIGKLHAGSPVLITQCGTLGDPGGNDNTWITRMPSAATARMLRSPDGVAQARRNNSAWLGRTRPHITPASTMSQVTGLDNRRLLPPYFPIMRGEDELFGYMLNYVYPDLAVLDYPWAAPHLPIPERDRSGEVGGFGGTPNFPRFFVKWVMINKTSCYSRTPEDRLAHLGAAFIDLGRSPPGEIEELYRDELVQGATGRITQLREQLAATGKASADWRSFLQAGIAEVERNLKQQAGNPPVSGTPDGLEGDELIALWQGHWREFGEALMAWPEVMEAAAGIRP